MSTPEQPPRPLQPEQPYRPPGWGAPGWPAPPGGSSPLAPGPPETCSRAVIALVLAIGSFVVLPLVPAVVALVVAHQAGREIAGSGGRLSGAGLVTAARVTAWVNVGLSVVVLVGLVVLVVAVVVTSAPA